MDNSDQKPPVMTYCGGKPNYCTPEGREHIIKMAREAGLDPDLWNYTDAFERFAVLVAAAEREACAKRLEAVGCGHCAANIRARGNK